MEAQTDRKLNRRQAISKIGWILVLPLAGLWYSMVSRKQDREGTRILQVKLDEIPEGASYYNDCIINREKMSIIVFSSRCTHLGCRLKMTGDGSLCCPCHGSVFSTQDGNPVKGPAVSRLERLNFTRDEDNLYIVTK
jgi:Rieske Fe-S protein